MRVTIDNTSNSFDEAADSRLQLKPNPCFSPEIAPESF